MDDFTRRLTLQTFENNINYRFSDINLLDEALTHASFSHEHKKNYDYERMELLGDSLLGFIVIDYMYKNYRHMSEGEISKIKSIVVSEPVLARASAAIGVPDYIQVGRGEELNGGRAKQSILADVFESVVGAIYLDSRKIEPPYEFVIHNINPEIIKFTGGDSDTTNYKSLLQEHSLKMYGVKPEYRLVKTLGPDHDKTFVISVEITEVSFGQGIAKVRREAEQLAARSAYNAIAALARRAGVNGPAS